MKKAIHILAIGLAFGAIAGVALACDNTQSSPPKNVAFEGTQTEQYKIVKCKQATPFEANVQVHVSGEVYTEENSDMPEYAVIKIKPIYQVRDVPNYMYRRNVYSEKHLPQKIFS